jgi:hypothetical protein
MVMPESNSQRSTQPYQMLAPASTTTLPTIVAFSATQASGWICGVWSPSE